MCACGVDLDHLHWVSILPQGKHLETNLAGLPAIAGNSPNGSILRPQRSHSGGCTVSLGRVLIIGFNRTRFSELMSLSRRRSLRSHEVWKQNRVRIGRANALIFRKRIQINLRTLGRRSRGSLASQRGGPILAIAIRLGRYQETNDSGFSTRIEVPKM